MEASEPAMKTSEPAIMSEPATERPSGEMNERPSGEMRAGRASQRCAETACGARYHINERFYVYPRCGGLLHGGIERGGLVRADELRDVWRARRASDDARDRSGVWRFRELLPFASDANPATPA